MKTATWLHCSHPNPQSPVRLICFPHAGGSSSFFRSWGKSMEDYEIHTVLYPGRAERINDPFPSDLQDLAIHIANAIEPLANCQIALFGHSMGAAIALETARALETRGISVAHLFASGSKHGPLPFKSRGSSTIEDDATICEQLIQMGGTDPELVTDPLFLELILPSVRADGQMFHAYDMALDPPLKCPVTTIYGDNDIHADIRPWRDITLTEFNEYQVVGDHFYLVSTPPFTELHEHLKPIQSLKDPLSLLENSFTLQTRKFNDKAKSKDVYEKIRERDQRYVWHPWSPLKADRAQLTLARGEGYRVWDTNGKEYIDGSSLNTTCGYGHQTLITAINEQLIKLHSTDISVANHEPVGLLAERLAQHLPEEMTKTLFVNSGSEGIEAAVFIAASYWQLIGDPRKRIITFAHGYHGSTVLSRSLSGLAEVEHPFEKPLIVNSIDLPLPPRQLRRPESLPLLLDLFEKALLDTSDGRPIAVVVEPFINVGGGIVLPHGFLQALRTLCDKTNTLLIIDEIFTGYGRSGKMFAFEHDNIVPDILISSKGLASGYMPITAVSVRESLHDIFEADPILHGLRYGHTNSGHAVSCTAALATLDVLEKEKLTEKAQIYGATLLEKFAGFAGVEDIVDVRGFGLVLVLDMISMQAASHLRDRAASFGLLLRQNNNVLMLVPPLIVDKEGINLIIARLSQALPLKNGIQ